LQQKEKELVQAKQELSSKDIHLTEHLQQLEANVVDIQHLTLESKYSVSNSLNLLLL
jgi:hypothetical protein